MTPNDGEAPRLVFELAGPLKHFSEAAGDPVPDWIRRRRLAYFKRDAPRVWTACWVFGTAPWERRRLPAAYEGRPWRRVGGRLNRWRTVAPTKGADARKQARRDHPFVGPGAYCRHWVGFALNSDTGPWVCVTGSAQCGYPRDAHPRPRPKRDARGYSTDRLVIDEVKDWPRA